MTVPVDEAAPLCPSCAAPLPSAVARFCPACGAPVTADPPPREKRKTVTLLFADVTGSTALGEQLDPEAYRGVLGRYFGVAKEAVERHGGRVEKFVGDAVLAVFGVPEVREDDALRAVRAARDLVASLDVLAAELERTLGVRLAVRTGINTGPVVTGSDRAGGSFATGDAVNTAARLEQAAGPGEVLLGESTFRLVRDAVTVETVDPVVAKGKAEPVRAYRLVDLDDEAVGRAWRPDAELVGRNRELRALDDALERTVASGRGHLVSVIGASGIGKSRLVRDFVGRIGGRARVVHGRCVSYGRGITYWPLVQIVRDAARLRGDESPEATARALFELLDPAPDAGEVASLLLPLLGAGSEPGDADQTAWAAARLVEQLALRKPLVIEIDDLHWAGSTLLELLERVLAETQDLPVLLVGQARPELLDEHPSWGRGSVNAVSLGLEPFARGETAASLTTQLGAEVGPEVVEAVADWSGGNPLFIEEIATHLVETGCLVQGPAGWAVVGDLAAAGVPATVSVLLATRLERLPPEEREILEAVSVIGLEFSTSQARHLSSGAGEPLPLLSTLSRRDLLRRERGGTGNAWSFRHVLIRDAAYDGVPKTARSRLHSRLADHLGTAPGGAGGAGAGGGEHAAFVFHHRERAASYAAELAPLDPGTRALADRAGDAAYEAIEVTLGNDLVVPALEIATRALALPISPARRRRTVLQVYRVSGFVGDLGTRDELLAHYGGSLDAPDEPGTETDRVYFRVLQLDVRLEQNDESVLDELIATAQRLEDLGVASGDDDLVLEARFARLVPQRWQGRWGVGLLDDPLVHGARARSLRRLLVVSSGGVLMLGPAPVARLISHAASLREPGQSPELSLTVDLFEAAGHAGGGALDAARLAELREAVDRSARDAGAVQRQSLSNLLAWSGDTPGAARLDDDVADQMVDRGQYGYASTFMLEAALHWVDASAPGTPVGDRLRDRIYTAATHTVASDVTSASLLATVRALVASRDGRHAEALRQAERAVEIVSRSDMTWHRADLHRRVAEVHEAAGDLEGARRHLTSARALYAEKGLLVWERRVADRLA